jgi:GTP-binding protein
VKFVDTAKLFVRSGNGGNGCASFRREKYIEFGGPDGGDGGDGGNVYIVGSAQLNTLQDLKLNPHQRAKNGRGGMGKQMTGRSGEDKIIAVPFGTIIVNVNTDEIICEILEEKQYQILKGGRGGLGNIHFKSSTNRAPRFAQDGAEGLELVLGLELKLMADVGLVGFPNAGKSTLISTISKARPKIADYPFTTLVPNLGVVKLESFKSFVVADIPGIIEGAHEGTGLGDQFLKHIQRTNVLAFLIDCSYLAEHIPLEAYEILVNELEKYSEELGDKKRVVLLSKIDAIDNELWTLEETQKSFDEIGVTTFPISSATRSGLDDLVKLLGNIIEEEKEAQEKAIEEALLQIEKDKKAQEKALLRDTRDF